MKQTHNHIKSIYEGKQALIKYPLDKLSKYNINVAQETKPEFKSKKTATESKTLTDKNPKSTQT